MKLSCYLIFVVNSFSSKIHTMCTMYLNQRSKIFFNISISTYKWIIFKIHARLYTNTNILTSVQYRTAITKQWQFTDSCYKATLLYVHRLQCVVFQFLRLRLTGSLHQYYLTSKTPYSPYILIFLASIVNSPTKNMYIYLYYKIYTSLGKEDTSH